MSTAQRGQIEYVIFDMDGLLSPSLFLSIILDFLPADRAQLIQRLSPSQKIYTDVTNELLQQQGYTKDFTWDIKAGTMGKPPVESVQALFAHYPGIEDKISIEGFMKARQELSEERFKRVDPMQGAARLVRHLHNAGVPIAIATGSSMESFIWKTTHLPEIFALFPKEVIITADQYHGRPGKPAPDIYLIAANALGRDVGQAAGASDAQVAEQKKGLVFEDAVPGVKSGVAAGMNVIWIPDDGLRGIYPSDDFGAAQVLRSLTEFKPEEWGLPALS